MTVGIVVADSNGGTGKTTSVIILSYLLLKMGLNVLALDLDHQEGLTVVLRAKGLDIAKALETLLTKYEEMERKRVDYDPRKLVDAREYITTVEFLGRHFDVIPGSRRIVIMERMLNDLIDGNRMLSWLLDGLDY